MPTYKYKCDNCVEKVELFHGMSDPTPLCASCGQTLSRDYKEARKKTQVNCSDKPGKVVDEFIKNAKDDLRTQTQELKSRKYQ